MSGGEGGESQNYKVSKISVSLKDTLTLLMVYWVAPRIKCACDYVNKMRILFEWLMAILDLIRREIIKQDSEIYQHK